MSCCKHGQKRGSWPAIDGTTPDPEREFNRQDMPRLRYVGLAKAVNQEELESSAGDGA